jgi:hypothetical protein
LSLEFCSNVRAVGLQNVTQSTVTEFGSSLPVGVAEATFVDLDWGVRINGMPSVGAPADQPNGDDRSR